MILNYVKVALRSIRRYKGYSFINITGLAVGVACCILILLWVDNERSYDTFHQKAERIYRLYSELTLGGVLKSSPVTGAPVGQALKQTYPEVERAARILPFGNVYAKYGDREFREDNILYADNSLFDIFTFPLIHGNPAALLTVPYTIVLTENAAHKYFGGENPVGKTLTFSDGHAYAITGVVKDIPSNSHITFDGLCSYETWVNENKEAAQSWGTIQHVTYVLLAPGTDSRLLEEKMAQLVGVNIDAVLKQAGGSIKLGLQPLLNVHLFSNFEIDSSKTGDIMYVYLFSGVALFILFIACVNFINLATARYSNRALEVGLRKTMGASRSSLIRQFLGETLIVTSLSVLLGCAISLSVLPVLQTLTGQEFSYLLFLRSTFLLRVILLILGIGILAGSYPAIFLSSFEPVKTLKGNFKKGAAIFNFRRVLVVGQFTISIALIIGTLVIFDQLNFVKQKHLGFSKEQVLAVPLPDNGPDIGARSVRQELIAVPGVVNAGISSYLPGQGFAMSNIRPQGRADKEAQLMQILDIDENFLNTLGIDITQGRNFSSSMETDAANSVIINQTAADILGWGDPLGRTLFVRGRRPDGGRVELPKKVVGVVKDFHTLSLHKKIEPLVISCMPQRYRIISLKLSSIGISETISKIMDRWENMFPGQTCNYSFLDESFDKLYTSEEQMNTVFRLFTVIAILISSLGLFGLAAYMTEKRTKEVGIRKVMGASVPGILYLLSKEFTKWVLIANVIAWPVAYYFMNTWLQTFAYRIEINLWIFLLSGCIALCIALVTVSFQSFKAARMNPVNSLRYE